MENGALSSLLHEFKGNFYVWSDLILLDSN